MGERFFSAISLAPYYWSLLAASEAESHFSVVVSLLNSSATGRSFSSAGVTLLKSATRTVLPAHLLVVTVRRHRLSDNAKKTCDQEIMQDRIPQLRTTSMCLEAGLP